MSEEIREKREKNWRLSASESFIKNYEIKKANR